MGLETIYPKPTLSQPGSLEHRIYPYLLHGLVIERPNQVGIDITYIRLASGWMYLVAILDRFSRYIVAWEREETLQIGVVLTRNDFF